MGELEHISRLRNFEALMNFETGCSGIEYRGIFKMICGLNEHYVNFDMYYNIV